MTMDLCAKCGRELQRDEVSLTMKLVNRGAEEYFCLSCLSDMFKVPEELLLKKIDHYRRQGCVLFQ